MECIFCKIANKEIKSDIIYEDEKILIFKDLNPTAPVHLLAIPKKHIASAEHVDEENCEYISHIFKTIAKFSNAWGLENGFRVVNNCCKNGGQTVMHIHFHILGGRELNWPAG